MSTAPEGYTLIEVLVGVAISIVLVGVLGSFIMFQNRELGAETHRVFSQQGLRSALELMADDLRSAGRREPGVSYAGITSPPGICVAEAGRVRVTADVDGDGNTAGAGEDVTYCLCAGSGARPLYRGYRPTAGAGFIVERIADDVTTLQYTYSPRRISAAMTIAVSSQLGTYSHGARGGAYLRNAADQVSCGSGPTCPPATCD